MAETDLISRQAAIDEIKEIYEWHDNVTKERIIEHFKQLPSAQPETIRCKDCLWRIGRDCARFTDLPVYMDDYCGRAKRRGEQDETDRCGEDVQGLIDEQPTVDTVNHGQKDTYMETDFYIIPMSYGTATDIIENSNENTDEQSMCSAIHKIMSGGKTSAVTKDVLMKAVKYLFDKRYVYLVKRD